MERRNPCPPMSPDCLFKSNFRMSHLFFVTLAECFYSFENFALKGHEALLKGFDQGGNV